MLIGISAGRVAGIASLMTPGFQLSMVNRLLNVPPRIYADIE
jgi:hypothetical protein